MKRISMWSGPRNMSTACMYAFHHRGDCRVIDEPYYAYYLARTGLDHPGREEVLASQSQDASQVTEELLTSEYPAELVFMKNMPHHMAGIDLAFVGQFENFFLIREPREIILSYLDKIPEPRMSDLGLDLQFNLFMDLKKHGKTPPVVDRMTLLSNPREVLSQLCNQLDIPFRESMLRWPAGAIPHDGAWAPYWYAGVHKSTGFSAPVHRDCSLFPYALEELAQACEQYYNEMKQHAITV